MLRRRALRRWTVGGLAVVVLVSMALQAVDGAQGKAGGPGRPDLIEIQTPQPVKGREMPTVYFLHDRHTEAIGGASCASCHGEQDAKTVFRFKRTGALAPGAARNHYHDNCIACHRETRDAGKPSGPLAADCRTCHRPQAPASNRVPLAFDRSLHYRHEQARSIRPDPEKDNCAACHHRFDPKAEKIVAAPGKEGSCRYCHQENATLDKAVNGPVRSIRSASHDSCVACHKRLAATQLKAGPVTCGGCHDAGRQAGIEKLARAPRLQRRQPDAVLMATRLKQAVAAQKKISAAVAAVAFDHRGHENAVGSCRACHHASLERCTACHTLNGDEKGGFVRLEQAMHTARANAGCLSCHEKAKSDPVCAGCHGQLPRKRFSDADCRLCHNVDLMAGDPVLGDKAAGAEQAAAVITARRGPMPAVARADIPETVKIAALADQYEAAVLPHGKIVRALADNLDGREMARSFHRDPTTLCQGCHHHSPPSLKPPACASCHGAPFADGAQGRPGLMGAYHGQCMGCHQKMGIEKPAASDCAACHKERPKV